MKSALLRSTTDKVAVMETNSNSIIRTPKAKDAESLAWIFPSYKETVRTRATKSPLSNTKPKTIKTGAKT